MRKEFALQLASTSFMTYLICLGSRSPNRFHWSRATGQIAMSEILPSTSLISSSRELIIDIVSRAGSNSQTPHFATPDVVPFRLTPNLQHLLGPILTEGILASGIMAIGRCLTEPEVHRRSRL